MYDELIKRLRETSIDFGELDHVSVMMIEAADAIEELQKITTHYEEESKGWWLAACDAKEERERLKEQLDNAEIENIKLKEEFARYRGKHRWIPVKERLPETHDYVLCCGAKGGMFVGYVSCFTEPQGFAWAWQHGGQGRKIKWWMPLPQPPESEGE